MSCVLDGLRVGPMGARRTGNMFLFIIAEYDNYRVHR